MKEFLMRFRNHPQTDNKPTHRRALDGMGGSDAAKTDDSLSVELATESTVLSISEHLLSSRNMALFRIKDEGLPGEHLYPGDFLILERRTVAGDGDLVVGTLSSGSTVLGRFFRNDDGIRIESVNPAGPRIQVGRTGLVVQGIVVGILRKYGTHE